jgi:hypothetical protein
MIICALCSGLLPHCLPMHREAGSGRALPPSMSDYGGSTLTLIPGCILPPLWDLPLVREGLRLEPEPGIAML